MRVADRYQLEAVIGQGGMGEVWRATDEVLTRRVAVKLLKQGSTDPEAAERFHREAQAAAVVNCFVSDRNDAQDGRVLGTSYYVAPERARAEPVGPASDIYSLGCVLYQLLTGDPPFMADTPTGVLRASTSSPFRSGRPAWTAASGTTSCACSPSVPPTDRTRRRWPPGAGTST